MTHLALTNPLPSLPSFASGHDLLGLLAQFSQPWAPPPTKSSTDQEAWVCVEVIQPLLAATGAPVATVNAEGTGWWREDDARQAPGTKGPDYTLFYQGERQCYLEVRRPDSPLTQARQAVYQLRRYAWSAGLSHAILTNGMEWRVYDGAKYPEASSASATRTGSALLANWQLDSPDAAAQLRQWCAPRRAAVADTQRSARWLADFINGWRLRLAESWANSNVVGIKYAASELDYAGYQRLLEIIALRRLEDLGMEPYGSLQRNAAGDWQAWLAYLNGLRGKYAITVDNLPPAVQAEHWEIATPLLASLLEQCYYPHCPLELSVLPVGALEQAWEYTLAMRIRYTSSGLRLDERPESQATGGPRRWPPGSAAYAAHLALAQLPAAEPVSVCDPLCGSGMMLTAAYRELLHRNALHHNALHRHTQDLCAQSTPPVVQRGLAPLRNRRGAEYLHFDERLRWLQHTVWGACADPLAIVATRIALLLALLEDPDAQPPPNTTLDLRFLHTQVRHIKLLCAPPKRTGAHQFSLLEPPAEYNAPTHDWSSNAATGTTGNAVASAFDRSTPFAAVLTAPPAWPLAQADCASTSKRGKARQRGYAHGAPGYALYLRQIPSMLAPGGTIAAWIPAAFLSREDLVGLRRRLARFLTLERLHSLPMTEGADLTLLVARNEEPAPHQMVLCSTPEQVARQADWLNATGVWIVQQTLARRKDWAKLAQGHSHNPHR